MVQQDYDDTLDGEGSSSSAIATTTMATERDPLLRCDILRTARGFNGSEETKASGRHLDGDSGQALHAGDNDGESYLGRSER